MHKRILAGVCVLLFVCTGSYPILAGDWFEQTETETVFIDGISRIDFENIDFTDYEYRGVEDAEEFTVTITYKVHARHPETADDVFRQFSLDVDRDDDRLSVRFDHPKQPEGNVFSWFFRRSWKKWKAAMVITGPIDADMHIDGDFSDFAVYATTGDMNLDVDFSDVRLFDHTGKLDAGVEFGSLTAERLDGSFNISCEFGDVDLSLSRLNSDSEMHVEFGSGTIDVPEQTGAAFITSQSFGDVDYHFNNQVRLDGKQRRVTLNNGGVTVKLSVEFGDIDVSDRGPRDKSASR